MNDVRDQSLRRFGESLARAMEVRGVSARDLAGATNIREARIERILRGEVETVSFEVPLLAEGLGIRPEDLAEGR